MKCFIGIDLGTSATKTIIVNEEGKVLASESCPYPMYQPQNGWAEQDPQDWENAVFQTVKDVVAKSGVNKDDIKGIGLSGQMHGLVMLDEAGKTLGKSIIWCDQRTEKQVQQMLEIMPMEKWMEITANPPLAAWTAAKILWVRENEPEKYQKCRRILLPKDYIRYLLTGAFSTDVSDASGMQLLDVKNRCWSEEILEKLEIDRSWLGEVYESQDITGTVHPEAAKRCGLGADTIVVGGASDNAAAAIGTGIVREGEAFTSIGTSAIVYTHMDKFRSIPDGGLHVCCAAVPGSWHTMGGPQSAGLSLEWFKNNFCKDLAEEAESRGKGIYELINEKVAEVPIGSDKLFFLPYLMGERTPHMNPFYRGAFIGLNAIHTQGNMLRAIMEGVTYSLADCNNILRELGVEVVSMKACGGGSRSPVWQKIMADLYECDIKTLKQEEGPAYGAVILAGVASGTWSSIEEACTRFVAEDKIIKSDKEEAELYKKYHRLFDKIYKDLSEDFELLANMDK